MSGSMFGIPVIMDEETEESFAGRRPQARPAQQPDAQGAFGSYTNSAPQGPHPFGAYYQNESVRPVSKGAAVTATVNPVAGAMLGASPLQAAGIGLGATALVVTAYIGVMGGIGYFIGGKLTPEGENESTYKWAGAIANVVLPGIGLGAEALVAMLKE